MSPFAQALLALEIAVDALHRVAPESKQSQSIAEDAFAQIEYLGFDTRAIDDQNQIADGQHAKREMARKQERPTKMKQKSFFE